MADPAALRTLLIRNLSLYAAAWLVVFGLLRIVFPLAPPPDVFGAAMLVGYCVFGLWVVRQIVARRHRNAFEMRTTFPLLMTIGFAAFHFGKTLLPGLADVHRMRSKIQALGALQSAEVSSGNARHRLDDADRETLLTSLRNSRCFHPSHDWDLWSGKLVLRLDDGADLEFSARIIERRPDDLVLTYWTRAGAASLQVSGAASIAAR